MSTIPQEAIEAAAKRREATDAILAATRFVLDERERELLELKGPCSWKECRLHYAHNGPCDTRPTTTPEVTA